MPNSLSNHPPSMVAWLGYGGLVPFVSLAAGALLGGDYAGLCSKALFAYGAVILSFVGALHWGFAMNVPNLSARHRNHAWAWSVVPALLAWVALLLDPAAAGVLMIAGFLAHYWQDRGLARLAALPPWYLPLRLRLTGVACICLAVGAAVARQRTVSA